MQIAAPLHREDRYSSAPHGGALGPTAAAA